MAGFSRDKHNSSQRITGDTSSSNQYSRIFKAKYRGKCQLCQKKVYVGQSIATGKQGGVAHSMCIDKRITQLSGGPTVSTNSRWVSRRHPDNSSKESAGDSVISLVKRMFDIDISTDNLYFSSYGWIYKTQVSVECADCEAGDFLHVFRKNTSMNRPQSKRVEYWCLVCLVCKTAVALNDYDSASVTLIKESYALKVEEFNSPSRKPRKRREWFEVENRPAEKPRSTIEESLLREELRHKERMKTIRKDTSEVSTAQVFVTSEPYRSMNGHDLFVNQSAGVSSQTRALEPWFGHCSCGFWDLIAGDPTGLQMNWTLHVQDHEERG